MASLEELQKKQADAAKFAMKMVDEKDPKVIIEMAEQMAARCKDLEKMANKTAIPISIFTPILGPKGVAS